MKKIAIALLVSTACFSSTKSIADGHGSLLMGFFAEAVVGSMVQSHYSKKLAAQSHDKTPLQPSQNQSQALTRQSFFVQQKPVSVGGAQTIGLQ